jgi:hypothetical protein
VTDDERRQMETSLPESMTRVEWWLRLSRLVAGFGDGHTSVYLPGEELNRDAAATVFPAALAVDEERQLTVTLSFAPPGVLRRGERIVEINGRAADSLVHEWMGDFSGESDLGNSFTAPSGARSAAT